MLAGGIPVCFPQFAGRGPLPKHGFARTSDEWEIDTMTSDGGTPVLALCLKDTEATRGVWPHGFKLRYVVTLTAEELSTEVQLTNTGERPLAFTGALHTYFAVDDVEKVEVLGLRGLTFEEGRTWCTATPCTFHQHLGLQGLTCNTDPAHGAPPRRAPSTRHRAAGPDVRGRSRTWCTPTPCAFHQVHC